MVRSHLALLGIPSPLKSAEVQGLKSLLFPIFSPNHSSAGIAAAGSELATYRGFGISTRIHIIKDFQASTAVCFPDFLLKRVTLDRAINTLPLMYKERLKELDLVTLERKRDRYPVGEDGEGRD